MHPHLLATHSILRWIFVVFILVSIIQSFSGWFGNKKYTKAANTFKTLTVATVHLQLIIGFILYFVSPLVSSFLSNVGASMSDKTLRFFGMEHAIMMIIAAVLITIGSAKSKKKATDTEKYKTIAIFFTIALLLVLIAAPSEFSPMNYRPNFSNF